MADEKEIQTSESDDLIDAAIDSHFADEMDGMGSSPQTAALIGAATTTLIDEVERDRLAAVRAERRSAYLDGVMDEHHPDL